jgi:dTDP-4-amino-4,6-dideoxygalactose transaminase
VFCDSSADQPNIDEDLIEGLITARTKAIVVVHYAGVACNMDKIMALAAKYNLYVVEDAAQAIDSYYTGADGIKRPLGSIGHLAAFSFHETKNIMCGEGGLLLINDEQFVERAEIVREKGTNRSKFFRGEIDKYGWVDIGSSFLPSDIIAAFLYAQLENLEDIQKKRTQIWNTYYTALESVAIRGGFTLPVIPSYATNNAHMFYIVAKSVDERDRIIGLLKENDINAVFHYQSLHKSEYYAGKHDGRFLQHSDRYTDCLLRLPMFYELDVERVINVLNTVI